jgi:hypothetical protein
MVQLKDWSKLYTSYRYLIALDLLGVIVDLAHLPPTLTKLSCLLCVIHCPESFVCKNMRFIEMNDCDMSDRVRIRLELLPSLLSGLSVAITFNTFDTNNS